MHLLTNKTTRSAPRPKVSTTSWELKHVYWCFYRTLNRLNSHKRGHCTCQSTPTSLREGWCLQNWWIFEKFQTAFDPPPPSFSENHVALFSGIHDRRSVYNGKNLQHKFLDWKWPPPSGSFPKIHPFWCGHPSLRVGGHFRCFDIYYYFHQLKIMYCQNINF